ncbi:hypothetical protein [Spirosoma sordidisoli]|uniref:Carboxypeptidase regulatory-like domain-containing protein n=1 Tax=Spirosoma sordidisoli TaxID=2502893 RepID=A0A4Q2UEX4_9BACT|nr:hypothetical protein [Spirosoma sordidisoli]RYC67737.1 hypothetical protein EQG79_23840 [Spirosoma sordidisoli]
MHKYLIFWAVYVSLSLPAIAQQASRQKATKQGICGTVVEKKGNMMPSVGPASARTNGAAVIREVLIFPLLNSSQVDAGENGFITSVRGVKPLKTVKSDKNGRFCVRMPVGKYTLMVREPKGLYANLSDSQNNIFPVSVQKNRQSTITVEISHSAVF